MRDITARSVKLNRDLDKMLLQALERDLLVRIGWGKQGDEKPKNGEIGVITHLPEKSRVLLLGDLGECAGAMNDGGTLTLQGGCSSMLGVVLKIWQNHHRKGRWRPGWPENGRWRDHCTGFCRA